MRNWLIAALLIAGNAVAAPIPVKDFLRNPEAADIRISPDGKHLAMTVPDADGRNFLVIVDRIGLKISASLRAREGDIIDSFRWVSDERVVASIATKFGGLDKPVSTGELYGVNADGGKSTMLFGYRADAPNQASHIKTREARRASARIVDTLRDDDKRILITVADWDARGRTDETKPDYGYLDVYSGKFMPVGTIPLPGAVLITDNSGTPRLAFSEDKQQFRQILVRGSGGNDWTKFEDSRNGPAITPLRFAADNQHFYALVSESSGPDGLYKIDIVSKKRELLYQGKADPCRIGTDSCLIDSRNGSDAFAVVTADGKMGNQIFDKQSIDGRLLMALEASFKDQWVDVINFTKDGKLALIRVESDRNPGDIYLFDTEKKTADYVTSPRRWIEPEQMAATQPIQFKARDGSVINAYLTMPNGNVGKNLPMVVVTHGGPYQDRDYWTFDSERQLLANRGYVVLQTNFRGSPGYGYGFQKAGYREWGGKMQDDVTDATRWAIAQGYADPKRICAFGASYGAYASLEGAAKEPDLYRCAIGYVGVYDLRRMRSGGDSFQSGFGDEAYLDLVLGSNKDELWARSPTAQVDRIKAKVMLISGGEDQRAPAVHSEDLRSAFKRKGVDVEWIYKRGEGHGYFKEENRLELYDKLLAFLDANIGTKPTP